MLLQCHTSSTVLAGEGWWVSLSSNLSRMFSLGDRSGFSKPLRWIPTTGCTRKMLEMYWSGSNYSPFELEICVSCTQCLPKSSHLYRFPILISNASRRLAVSSELPDRYMATRILHAKPGFIWNDNIIEPFLYSAFSFGTPESSSLYATLPRKPK